MALAPARRQAIIWTNGGWFADAYMRQLNCKTLDLSVT